MGINLGLKRLDLCLPDQFLLFVQRRYFQLVGKEMGEAVRQFDVQLGDAVFFQAEQLQRADGSVLFDKRYDNGRAKTAGRIGQPISARVSGATIMPVVRAVFVEEC